MGNKGAAWTAWSLLIAASTAGCAVGPSLEVPDNSTRICQSTLAGDTDYWFGVPITNTSPHAITLKSVQLGEHDHVKLSNVMVVPPIRLEDGTTLEFGVTHDPAAQNAALWAGRQPVAAYLIPPTATVSLAIALRPEADDTGSVASEVVTYRVDGEPRDRTATSRLTLVLASDCPAALEEDV